MMILIDLATNKFRNNNYLVYKKGQSYRLNGEIRLVEENELLIAIKK